MINKFTIDHPVEHCENGFLLGNGDLSVSVYQRHGSIIFQLGKSDLWDERINHAENKKPANINELKDALEKYGVVSDGVTFKHKISPDAPQRIKDICQYPTGKSHGTPMPKPGAEFIFHYPPDLRNMKINQELLLDKGKLIINYAWETGVKLSLECVVHPADNRLSIRWKMSGWNRKTALGGGFHGIPSAYPAWFTLFRHTEHPQEFLRNMHLNIRAEFFDYSLGTLPSPLPPAEFPDSYGYPAAIQKFYDGKCFATATSMPKNWTTHYQDEMCHILPPNRMTTSGEIFIAVNTAKSADIAAKNAIGLVKKGSIAKDFAAAEKAAEKFWEKSSLTIDEPDFERYWYAALHAKRCVLRPDALPPGLALPSTLQDYSLCNGDLHMNYNYQEIFLGSYETNHPETGDAFFAGIQEHIKLGRKIARDYFNSESCFIQLCAFPFPLADDPFGSIPLGRMCYMTGWVAAWYFRRWNYTRDRKFLKETAYPMLKEFAQFYTDFMELRDDGFYHAYPSNQGESDFTIAGATDQPQVLRHARHALWCAVQAAKELDCDHDLAAKWQEICDKTIPETQGPTPPPDLPAEFTGYDGDPMPGKEKPCFLVPQWRWYQFYPGQVSYRLSTYIYNRVWNSKRDHQDLVDYLARWQMPNGLLRSTSAPHWWYVGAQSEMLGIAGAISAMLLLCRDNRIELFGSWPENKDAEFTDFCAEGAFLVSAAKRSGRVAFVNIKAQVNGKCRILNPWKSGKILFNGREKMVGKVIEFTLKAGEKAEILPL